MLQNTENLLINAGDQHEKRLLQTLIALQQNELDKHFEDLAQGQIVRSRVKWAELGEKNTKYFLNLEKHHATKKAVFKLQSASGISADQKEILTLLKNFYSSLYSEENNSDFNIDKYLSHINLPTLNTKETKLCDLEISESECWLTLNEMSKNKPPGPDCFPAEFYMTFWGELKSLFLSCITYSILMGEINPTQSQGIITLIPKKTLSPSSYRPITLLICDYKLISKLVNNRMKRFLTTLTHSDQSGFVKGRSLYR